MARRHRKNTVNGQRDLFNPLLDNPFDQSITSDVTSLLLPDAIQRPIFDPVEDLRLFEPDPMPSPRSRSGGRARYSSRVSSSRSAELPRGLGLTFESPKTAMVCVRRQERRQVLHAFKKTGRGGGRKPRWNFNSNIRCK